MKELTHNDLTENLIKETDMQLPSSRREIEEDMLEQICLIANTGIQVTVEELCSRMDMTKREVSFYLKQLNAHGYIIREKNTHTGYQKDGTGSGISLTEFGKITGEEFQYRHEILTQFLQFVGVSDEKAQEDACRMEHVVSEETVQQICNFVDYGDTFERILKHSDLRSWYQTGKYMFLMGIYQIEKTCPRRFAREFDCFSENIWLHITEDKSSFELIKKRRYFGAEFMVQRSGTGMDTGRGENGKSLDTVQCVSIFNTMPGPDHRRNCVDRVYEKR